MFFSRSVNPSLEMSVMMPSILLPVCAYRLSVSSGLKTICPMLDSPVSLTSLPQGVTLTSVLMMTTFSFQCGSRFSKSV